MSIADKVFIEINPEFNGVAIIRTSDGGNIVSVICKDPELEEDLRKTAENVLRLVESGIIK